MSERLRNTKRNIYVGFISRCVNLIFPFIINSIIVNTLGVEYLGLNSLFASILQVLSLAELGIGVALVYSMYEPIADGDDKKVCYLLKLYRNIYLVVGAIILSGGLCCIPFLKNLIDGEIPDGLNIYILFLFSLSNTCISYFLFSYRTSLLQASQRLDIQDVISLITNGTLNVAKIVVLSITKDYYLFCLLVPIFTILSNIIVYVVTRKRFPQYHCEGKVPKNELKDILHRVFGLFLSKICDVICNSFDVIIISGYLGLTILGKYNNYFYVANALTTVLGIIIASAVPSIGNSIVRETQKKNYEDFRFLQFSFTFVTTWAGVFLLCLYQPFIELWVGPDMLLNSSIPVLLCIHVYFNKSQEVFMAYRQAAGIWSKDIIRPITEAILNLTLNIFLVRTIGILGVVLATVVTTGVIRTVWGAYYLFKEYFTEYSFLKYLFSLLIGFIIFCTTGAVTYFVASMINLTLVATLLIRGCICIVIPFVMFIGVYSKVPECKKLYNFIKLNLKIRK